MAESERTSPGPAPSSHPTAGLPGISGWPEWRHDGYRSGCSALPGNVTQPAEHWRYFLGAPLTNGVDDQTEKPPSDLHDLDGTGGVYRVQVNANTLVVVDGQTGDSVANYSLKPCKDGYYAPIVARFAPDRPGLQVVVWPVEGNYFGDFQDQACCFSFAKGVRNGEVLWTAVPPTGLIHTPSFMVADLKKAGALDLVVMAWDGVTVWNGATGHLDYDVRWHTLRHYGLGACVDVPFARFPLIVNVADYVPHVYVVEITNDSGTGRLLWERRYDQEVKKTATATVMLRTRPNSLSDLDGDGVPEIVFNLFNDQGDMKWHLTILDLRTGHTLLDVPDQFVWGLEDLNGDGQPELLCSQATQADPRTLGNLAVYRWNPAGLQRLWQTRNARFLVATRHTLPPSMFTSAIEGRSTAFLADVDRDGVKEFLLEKDTDGDRQPDRFEAYAFGAQGRAKRKWHYQAPAGEMVNARTYSDLDDDGVPELQLCDPASGDVIAVDVQGKPISRIPDAVRGYATVPVAADLDGDGRCEIAVVNSRREVELLAASRAGKNEPVERLWKKHGQGMVLYQGYTWPDFMVLLADVDGDGKAEALFSSEARDGVATLVAVRGDGSTLWERRFAGVGTDGIYSGITRWFTGRFLGHPYQDVGVVYHQIGNGSNQMAMLDGRTGRVVWDGVSTVPLPGGGGPALVGNRPLQAVHDFDGDGRDGIAYNDVYFNVILSGATGQALEGQGVVDIYGTTLNYAYLIAADVNHDGVMELVLHGPLMHTMAQTHDMKKLWFRDFQNQANHFPPAFAVVDGVTVLGMPGEDGVFRCLRASDGESLWEEALGHPGATTVGSADVDGDGSPEFFYLDKNGELVVVRSQVKEGQPRVLWTFPVGPGLHPIFADVDGDGKGEFLLVTQEGYLRCIGQAMAQ